MLEVGKQYTTSEFVKELGISDSVWRKKRTEWLENVRQCYDYDITKKGSYTYYTILKYLGGEIQSPSAKNTKRKLQNDELRRSLIKEEIEMAAGDYRTEEGTMIMTAAGMYRALQQTHEKEIAAMGYTKKTEEEYTRQCMKKMFGTVKGEGGSDGKIVGRAWCFLNDDGCTYTKMPEDLIKIMRAGFNSTTEDNELIQEIEGQYQNKDITKEEYYYALGEVKANRIKYARDRIYAQVGKYPVLATEYLLYAWEDEEKKFK